VSAEAEVAAAVNEEDVVAHWVAPVEEGRPAIVNAAEVETLEQELVSTARVEADAELGQAVTRSLGGESVEAIAQTKAVSGLDSLKYGLTSARKGSRRKKRRAKSKQLAMTAAHDDGPGGGSASGSAAASFAVSDGISVGGRRTVGQSATTAARDDGSGGGSARGSTADSFAVSDGISVGDGRTVGLSLSKGVLYYPRAFKVLPSVVAGHDESILAAGERKEQVEVVAELAVVKRAAQVAEAELAAAERAVVAVSARGQWADETNSYLVWFDRGRMIFRGAEGSGSGFTTLFDGVVTGLDSVTCCLVLKSTRDYFDSIERSEDGVCVVRRRRADGIEEEVMWLCDKWLWDTLMRLAYKEWRDEDGNVTWW